MVLVDTSVWIEVFSKSPFPLESVVALDDIVTCLPVIQETLQGFRDDKDFAIARRALFSFPVVESPLEDEVVVEAAHLYRAAMRAGHPLRSGVNCLIAACAIRNHLTILHNDRDFDQLARVSSLDARSIRA